jgi:hypothetical protein
MESSVKLTVHGKFIDSSWFTECVGKFTETEAHGSRKVHAYFSTSSCKFKVRRQVRIVLAKFTDDLDHGPDCSLKTIVLG